MLKFAAMPTEEAAAFRVGAKDAYGNPPERVISNGQGNPCRHCLQQVPEGKEMLILAYRPFRDLHPYAETGPIFLCADACQRGGGTDLPEVLQSSPDYLIKGYGADNRIVYGTGLIVPPGEMTAKATDIFAKPDIAYIHVRSARNNCYLARIDRAGD